MYITVLLFIAGFTLIIKGGDFFVGASISIAKYARMPRIVIGSTIVSIATTSPEFIVSTTASISGQPAIAIGNAVGSAILNIGFILAITCMVRAIPVKQRQFRFPAFSLLVAAVLLTLLTLRLTLSRPSGILLIALGLLYLGFDYRRSRRSPSSEDNEQGKEVSVDERMGTLPRAIFFFVLGLLMVIGGSKLMIDSAIEIAEAMGVSPIFIGLTIVALGTSLPELVTAVASVRKGVADLSLGNIVGAGLLNCTIVTGTAATIRPLKMAQTTQLYALPALVAIVGLLIILSRLGNRLSRRDGGILLAFYVAYVIGLVLLKVS